jgi:hypothetical protein
MLAADETGAPLEIERLVRDEGVADPLLGTAIGPWRIVEGIGRGGAGAVDRVVAPATRSAPPPARSTSRRFWCGSTNVPTRVSCWMTCGFAPSERSANGMS